MKDGCCGGWVEGICLPCAERRATSSNHEDRRPSVRADCALCCRRILPAEMLACLAGQKQILAKPFPFTGYGVCCSRTEQAALLSKNSVRTNKPLRFSEGPSAMPWCSCAGYVVVVWRVVFGVWVEEVKGGIFVCFVRR
jgi:hypothetical protein